MKQTHLETYQSEKFLLPKFKILELVIPEKDIISKKVKKYFINVKDFFPKFSQAYLKDSRDRSLKCSIMS